VVHSRGHIGRGKNLFHPARRPTFSPLRFIDVIPPREKRRRAASTGFLIYRRRSISNIDVVGAIAGRRMLFPAKLLLSLLYHAQMRFDAARIARELFQRLLRTLIIHLLARLPRFFAKCFGGCLRISMLLRCFFLSFFFFSSFFLSFFFFFSLMITTGWKRRAFRSFYSLGEN